MGYEGAHTDKETLDPYFLARLRDACCTLDWEALPTKRTPGEVDKDDDAFSWDSYGSMPLSPFYDGVVDPDEITKRYEMVNYIEENADLVLLMIEDQMGFDKFSMIVKMVEGYKDV